MDSRQNKVIVCFDRTAIRDCVAYVSLFDFRDFFHVFFLMLHSQLMTEFWLEKKRKLFLTHYLNYFYHWFLTSF